MNTPAFVRLPLTFSRLLAVSERNRYLLLSVLAVLNSLLDALAILVLVPFLSVLTGQPMSGVAGVLAPIDSSDPVLLAGLAAALFVIRGLTSVVLYRAQISLLNRGTVRLTGELLESYAGGLLRTEESYGSGSIVRLIGASTFAALIGCGSALFAIVSDVAIMITVVTVLIVMEPLMTLLAVGYLALIALSYLRGVKIRTRNAGEQAQMLGTRINNSLIEYSRGLRDLVIAGEVGDYVANVRRVIGRQTEATRTIAVIGYGSRYLMEGVLVAGIGLAVVVIQLRDPNTSLLASVGLLLVGAFRVLPALSGILSNLASLIATTADLEWVTEARADFRGEALVVASKIHPQVFRDDLSGRMVFNDVSFRYEGRSEQAVSGLNLDLPVGSSLGIVGASGAGKSTVLDLMLGLIDPQTGSICVGEDLALSSCRREWQGLIGYVPQDVFVLNATIAENVRFAFGDRSDDDEAVWEALRLARLEPEISALAGGIHHLLGESGLGLSGGQKQRLGIARAIYRSPKLLVLDEITSAMDSATEAGITELLKRLEGRVSCVIVAHRLSTIRHCNHVVVMDRGRVVDEGPYDELFRSSGAFQKLIAQSDLVGD